MRCFFLLLVAGLVSSSAQAQTIRGCQAHHPKYIAGHVEISYSANCTGHDEPELEPVSGAADSARDLTWTVVLPADGERLVSDFDLFWFGGVLRDSHSLLNQAFVELQLYPDSVVTKCFANGGFSINFSADTYSACSPVFKVVPNNPRSHHFTETVAFNAMLEDSADPGHPLLMHAGDTITVHFFVTPEADGFHVTVEDLTTSQSGTIVFNSQSDGPLMPFFSSQEIGNSLGWGVVNDTPNSFVWEIGHSSSGKFSVCFPGQTDCDSYDASAWAGLGAPIQIQSVIFGDGSTPTDFAVVSDQGGKAEVRKTCPVYGAPFCIYPWYTLGASGYHYGIDYPDTIEDFGKANQFVQTQQCGGPFGWDTTYCSTVLK